MTVAVDVLGPTVVRVAGVEVPLGPAGRRLLTLLARRSPQAVASDELIDALWPDGPPRTARASLQNQVSRIRSALDPTAILTVGDAYALGPTVRVDLAEVRAAAAQLGELVDRDPAEAFALADAALARWRGVPLASLDPDTPGIEAERRPLVELEHALEALRLDAAVADRRLDWAVAESERLVERRPHDERRWAALVRSLTATGRRGDALGAADRARRVLAQDLGLEPGPELRAAELAALVVEPATHTPAPMRPVGRDQQVAAIVACAERGASTLVLGPSGVGRTTVLQEVARRLRAGRRLRVVTAGVPRFAGTAAATLHALLEDLGHRAPQGAPIVEEFERVVARAAAAQPLAIVVDDLHHAGPSTRAGLAACARHDAVAVIASADGSADAALLPDAEPVDLPGLGSADVAALASNLLGRPVPSDDPRVDWLRRLTGGTPAFVCALLAEGAWRDQFDGPAETWRAPAALTVPSPMRAVVARRLERLDHSALDAVEALAVLGGRTTRAVLERLSSAAGVDRAVHAQVVDVDGDDVGFTEAAVGHVVLESLPPGQRAERHHHAGTVLRSTAAPAAVWAPHLVAAADLDAEAAARAALAAGREATATGAHADAALWYAEAHRIAGRRTTGGPLAAEAAIAHGDALRLTGDPTHEQVLLEATRAALETGDHGLVADAAYALLQLGSTTETGRVHEQAVAAADQALAILRAPAQRAVVCAALSLTHSMNGRSDQCRALFVEAESMALDRATRRKVLPFAYLGLGAPDDLERREQLAAELVGLAEIDDDPVAEFEGLHLLFSCALQRGEGARLRRIHRRMSDLARPVGDVGRRWALRYLAAALAHLDGDLDRAEHESEAALALLGAAAPSRAMAVYSAQLLVLRWEQGRLAELRPALDALIVEQPLMPAWYAAAALAAAEDDNPAAATASLDALGIDDPNTVPVDFMWLPLTMVAAHAAGRVGDVDRARALYRRLLPYGERVCWQGTCSYGPVASTLALLARVLGDDPAARTHDRTAERLRDSLGVSSSS